MEPELENGDSFPPNSHSASEMYVNEELEKDMQRLKNEIDMFQVELLALEKENLTSKRVSHFSLALVFLFLDDMVHFDFPFMNKALSSKEVIVGDFLLGTWKRRT